jgi:deazaflavin-dependent oxidoreductase (nitroreductase family)
VPAAVDFNDSNQQIIDEFRANGGKVGGQFDGARLLLLHTTGAKSGQRRVNPLAYRRDGDRLVVFGTKGGAPTNPDWYHNVRANRRAAVEVGTEQFDVDARVAEPDERDRIWRLQTEEIPAFAQYEDKTDRTIPVVILERVA